MIETGLVGPSISRLGKNVIPWKPSNFIILDMASVKPHSKAETFLIFSQIDQNIRRVYSKELSHCDD